MKNIIFFLLLLFSTSGVAEVWDDISRLNQETVQRIINVQSENDVVHTLRSLPPNTKVVISGTRHSQGGHIVYPNAVVLNMTTFNKVLAVSKEQKTVTVQSGATWANIQEQVNNHGLAVKVMQSSNIFSIGGSLSANIHGRDPNFGPIIETIKSLKVALASGEIVIVSRTNMPDLFNSAIGGYGLLGVILEAEIELTENIPLLKTTIRTDYQVYTKSLLEKIDKLSLHYGRCSFVKDDTFLKECYSTNFYTSDLKPRKSTLTEEEHTQRNSFIFNQSRKGNIGKKIRWKLQKELIDIPGEKQLIDRNNAMSPPIKFLEYKSKKDTDILQEYFVPISEFSDFMDDMRKEFLASDVNLLSITLRYLKENKESSLNYSDENMIAIVLYINMGLDEKSILEAAEWTRNLVSAALKYKGTYYLTYQRFPSLKQFQTAYPDWKKFKEIKYKYDPNLIFLNIFYEQYFSSSSIQKNDSFENYQ